MFQHYYPRYTVKEAMKLLGCGRARLYEYIKDGILESYKVKGRRYLTPEGIDQVVACEKQVRVPKINNGFSPDFEHII